jgi:hypothetical protein
LPKRPSDFAPDVNGFGNGLLARQYLGAAEVAAIGNGFEMVCAKNLLRLQCHFSELRSIRAGIGHLVRNDQMMLRVHPTCTL